MRSPSTSSDHHPSSSPPSSSTSTGIALHSPSSRSDELSRTRMLLATSFSNNHNKPTTTTCRVLLLSLTTFLATFIFVHQFLVQPQMNKLFLMLDSHPAKLCIEMEDNSFHCTDHHPHTHDDVAVVTSSSGKKNYHPKKKIPKKQQQQQQQQPQQDTTTYYYPGSVSQNISGSKEERQKMMEVIQSMEQYYTRWQTTIANMGRRSNDEENLNRLCANNNERCVFWASVDECEKNPEYMMYDCTLACQSCEQFLGLTVVPRMTQNTE